MPVSLWGWAGTQSVTMGGALAGFPSGREGGGEMRRILPWFILVIFCMGCGWIGEKEVSCQFTVIVPIGDDDCEESITFHYGGISSVSCGRTKLYCVSGNEDRWERLHNGGTKASKFWGVNCNDEPHEYIDWCR